MATVDFHDLGYKLNECCKAFNILKSSIKDHLSRRTIKKNIEVKIIFIKQEDRQIIQYMDEMLEVG